MSPHKTRTHNIMQSHYITASRHCITPLRHNTRSTRSTAYTVGRRYKPISFHNRAMRHSRATLLPQNVPQQFCAAPLGNALPLFRRWRVRIDPVSNKLGDTFSTLGRHYKPISFPNRAARHPRATLRHFFVAKTYALIPLSNKPGDTFGNAYTLGRHYKPISFHNRAARHPRATLCHFFVAETYALIPS